MSATGLVVSPVATPAASDVELVGRVRGGDDTAFEELYRRYHRRIAAFVRRLVRDEARTEDLTQEVFLSALRRMRVTETPIAFKPWVYEIARNAAIDHYRRTARAEEVSMDAAEQLRPSDRRRLVGSGAPDAELIAKERLELLRGAFDELSETHHRVLVMRELEGLSYREIAEQLELTRPAVESALFRARRRLEYEYEELSEGRRCKSMRGVMARLAEGVSSEADTRRLARHARRCTGCRRRARELGVEPVPARRAALVTRAAALLPLPAFFRRRAAGSTEDHAVGHLAAPAGQIGAAVAERAAALVAAAAIAGAGGFVLDRSEGRDRALPGGIVPPAAQTQPDPVAPTSGPSATEQPALRLPGLALFGPPFPQPAERAPVERPGAKSSSNRDSASAEQQQSSGRLVRQLGRPVRGVLGDSSRLPSLGKLTAPLRPGNKGLIPGREPAPAVPQDPGPIGASVSPDRRPLARVASAVRTLTLAATGGAAEAVSAEE